MQCIVWKSIWKLSSLWQYHAFFMAQWVNLSVQKLHKSVNKKAATFIISLNRFTKCTSKSDISNVTVSINSYGMVFTKRVHLNRLAGTTKYRRGIPALLTFFIRSQRKYKKAGVNKHALLGKHAWAHLGAKEVGLGTHNLSSKEKKKSWAWRPSPPLWSFDVYNLHGYPTQTEVLVNE